MIQLLTKFAERVTPTRLASTTTLMPSSATSKSGKRRVASCLLKACAPAHAQPAEAQGDILVLPL